MTLQFRKSDSRGKGDCDFLSGTFFSIDILTFEDPKK